MRSLADKLTLVIPTHYRHHYLARVLAFYQGSPLTPLVIDSTNAPFPELPRFPGIDYRHRPDVPLLTKLRQPLLDIATPYVLLCADDSFILPCAAAACVEHLDAHPEIHAVHGLQVAVKRQKDGTLLYEPCYTQDKDLRIDSPLPAERLRQLYRPYSPTMYAVHRSQNLRDFITTATGNAINDVLLELVSAMTAAVNGSHAVLPLFYHVTEIVPSILDDKKRRLPGAAAIFGKPEHAKAREVFASALAGFYARRVGCAVDEARDAVEGSIAAYMQTQGGRPRRPFWKKLPRYVVNAAAGLGWRSNDYGSWAETLAHKKEQKARETADPEQVLRAYLGPQDEKAWTEFSSIQALMTEYYRNRP